MAFLFKGEEDRTVEKLADIYADAEILHNTIELVLDGKLSGEQIKGKSVLLKPNWVKQSKNSYDEICLRTHDNFILVTLRILLKMAPSKVLIADAPIQGCNWDHMISEYLQGEIDRLSTEFDIPVHIKDFRRRTYNFAENSANAEINPLSDYVIFDVGQDSMLEPITTGQSNFRVTDYDPDRMSSAHAPGIHKYCIARDFFDTDVVISLPKIKTHQKAGLTGALKNLVGINGDKDFLPHHRIGGTNRGGDCYPGRSSLRYWSEQALDGANRRQGKKSFWLLQKFSSLLWKLSFPGPEHQMAAGWYGNDTTWRMVMDLNRIAEYGDVSGKLKDKAQRQLFSLCDAVIGGQGDGPLEPDPLPLGIISFTNSSFLNDYVMAKLMGLPVEKIPLLYGKHMDSKLGAEIRLDNEKVTLGELQEYAIKAIPPKGWLAYFNDSK